MADICIFTLFSDPINPMAFNSLYDNDYYPFGMVMSERSYTSGDGYRFGFNGKENDSETYSGSVAFEARIYDSRLGRFLTRDPKEIAYPWQSTYVFAANSPVSLIDYLGMDSRKPVHGESRTIDGCTEYFDATMSGENSDGTTWYGGWSDVIPKAKSDYEEGSFEMRLIKTNDWFANTQNGLTSFSNALDKMITAIDKLQEKLPEGTDPADNIPQNAGPHNYTVEDAREALRYIYDHYGKEMAIVVERMYRSETSHFNSKQYRLTGTGGMEAHKENYPYGWNAQVWTKYPNLAPTGLTSMYENKGISGQGGNAQVTDKPKQYLIFPSVKAAMIYKAEYINRYNGNWARWHSTDPSAQAAYRTFIVGIKPRIVNSFEDAQ